MPRSSLTVLRWVSLAEATSYLLLLVATLLKYTGPEEEIGVQVLGPIHGALFLAYVVVAVVVAFRRRWPVMRTLVVLAASVIPAAPFVVDRVWLREEERAETVTRTS